MLEDGLQILNDCYSLVFLTHFTQTTYGTHTIVQEHPLNCFIHWKVRLVHIFPKFGAQILWVFTSFWRWYQSYFRFPHGMSAETQRFTHAIQP